MKIYDFKALTSRGKELDFAQFEGKVLLIVNTASKCGFTPQFKGLEELNQKYKERGLVIIGFPCNQFKEQDPGNDSQIEEFCQLNYGVTFQIMKKIDVNGENADPIFVYLKQQAPAEEYKGLKAKAAHALFKKIRGADRCRVGVLPSRMDRGPDGTLLRGKRKIQSALGC